MDENAPPPAEYARAIIFQGGKPEPESQACVIGLLPVGLETSISKLDCMYNGGRGGSVWYSARYFGGPRSTAINPLIASVMSSVAEITAALFQVAPTAAPMTSGRI